MERLAKRNLVQEIKFWEEMVQKPGRAKTNTNTCAGYG